MTRESRDLARGEMAVLALLAEKPAHGWLLAQTLAPSGEIGQIWSGDRQRVYRALRKLSEEGLIEAALTEQGDGAHRTVFRPTAEGAAHLRTWLDEPVDNMREAQSTFVLKLVFRQRAGLEAMPLLRAQRASVVAAIESISTKLSRDESGEQLHLRLRLETARALLTFIDGLSAEAASRSVPRRTAPGGRRNRAAAAGSRVSDFTGQELGLSGAATIILRFDDARRGIVVAEAHASDPIVAEIVSVAHEVEAGRATGEPG